MIKQIHITDIYRLLREAVRFYSALNPHTRPNTFAVLDNEKDINSESLFGFTIRDKNKPHFFSRAWEHTKYNPSSLIWHYPAIFVFENDLTINDIFNETKERYWSIDIHAMIPEWDHVANKPDSVHYKNVFELYNDAEDMLFGMLKYLDRSCIASTNLNGEKLLYNLDYLEYLATKPGSTFTYEVDVPLSKSINPVFAKANRSTIMKKYRHVALKTVGVQMTLNVPTQCSTHHIFHFYDDYGVTPDKAVNISKFNHGSVTVPPGNFIIDDQGLPVMDVDNKAIVTI